METFKDLVKRVLEKMKVSNILKYKILELFEEECEFRMKGYHSKHKNN